METIIVPENTAISNGVSTSCKMIISDFGNNNNLSILDYGCGRLRNTKYLLENSFNVSITDTNLQISKQLDKINDLNIHNYFVNDNIDFSIKYDVILSSFVLNVIPDIENRNKVLSNIYSLLKENGCAYIEVRSDKFIKSLKNKMTFKDGFLIGKNKYKTFQKPYSMIEIKEYVILHDFEIIYSKSNGNSHILKVKKRSSL